MRPDAELGAQLLEKLKVQGIDTTLERASQAAALLKERATFVEDMLEGTYLFTHGSPLPDNVPAKVELKKRWKTEVAPVIEEFVSRLEAKQPGTNAEFQAIFEDLLQEKGMKIGQVMPPYRLFVAGTMQGPGMFDVSALLGSTEVAVRLKAGLDLCREWA